jgi:glycosyltransferase involved in cell wall biosynthesis
MSKFAYLVTIHNAAHCLEGTLRNLYANKGLDSEVIAILDGCTDASEQIVDIFNSMIPSLERQIIKLHTPDVHEILALNVGFRYIQEQNLADYAVTVQDDTWLLDPDLESITLDMFNKHLRLGHIVFRMGCNYTPNMDLLDLVDNHCSQPSIGHTLARHQYCKRMIGSKSPSVIPMWVLNRYGLLDEKLAPRGYDDIDLSLTLLEKGYETMVFATDWRSDLHWGATRRGAPQPVEEQDNRNKLYVRNKHQHILDTFRAPEEYRQIYDY